MEDTARLFIVLIGFCFLIVFVVWIFIAFSKTRVVLDNTNEAVRVCGEGNVINYAICLTTAKLVCISMVHGVVVNTKRTSINWLSQFLRVHQAKVVQF